MNDTGHAPALSVSADENARVDPWAWRADTDSWCAAFADRARGWSAHAALQVDRHRVVTALGGACTTGEKWICHPLAGAVMHDRAEGRSERDLGLLMWLASHGALDASIELADEVWCWTPDGGARVAAGRHDLSDLARSLRLGRTGLAVDPWCTVLGYAPPDTILATIDDSGDRETAIRESVKVVLRAEAIATAAVPAAMGWIASLVQAVVPLDRRGPLARSASGPDLPGLVFLDAVSEIAVLELLAHEGAHHLLYAAEAAGPLIEPAESGLYHSPLRADPRPLRGILLAYHALAYICALYADLDRCALTKGVCDAADVSDLGEKRDEAAATLHHSIDAFTDRGRDFLRRTDEVAAHAR